MSTHVTYGDYSHVAIRKVICVRCKAPIKKYNLQLLLTHDECLCPSCQPVIPVTKESNHGPL
ncbi:hypothetical protein EKK58_00355 [Candidatus Dependentiae bacterium]|nr:MAG: hypothetical protein EKK58_00355 [Candidatus Dependentiae bacterium]